MYRFKNIWLDPGHYAGANVDPRNPHYSEGDTMLELGLRLKKAFAEKGIKINLTREDGRNLSLASRGKMAANADLFISLHTDYPADDTLIFYSLLRPEDKEMAENIGTTIAKHLGVGFRRARTRVSAHSTPQKPRDYYGVIRNAVNYGAKHVFLLEHCGHAQMAVDTDNKIEKIVQAYLELFSGEHTGTPIIGEPQATVEQAQEWARRRGAHQRFIDIAPVYWEYCRLTGIRPEILYCQAAKETAFGKYGGAVTPDMYNWAGIKTSNASGDKTEDHQRFASPADGVRGHFNHIGAYVGVEPVGEPHPRWHIVKKLSWAGTIKTVEELGGRWAPNSKYGESIINDYLKELLATKPPEHDDINELKQEILRLRKQVVNLENRISNITEYAKKLLDM